MPHSSLNSGSERDTDVESHSEDQSSDVESVEFAPRPPLDASSSSDSGAPSPPLTFFHAQRRDTYTKTRPLTRQGDNVDSHDSRNGARQRAWYEFDLAVMLILISPIGNWLTGGDHVKNLMFLVLLVFYLRQVIEVPWTLYEKSRGPKPPLPPLTQSIEDKNRELAFSELRSFELASLTLTVFSPFAGAYLLRYVTTAIIGPDSISWFSTGLFVMASGIRPWSHLVERLNQRASDLQDFVRFPNRPGYGDDVHEKIDNLMKRIEEMEQNLVGTHAQQDVAVDHLDFRLTSIKRSMRKREKLWGKLEERVRSVEESVSAHSASGPGHGPISNKKKSGSMTVSNITSMAARRFSYLVPTGSVSPTLGEGPQGSRRHTLQPVLGSSVSGRANTVNEMEGKRDPLLARPLRFVMTVLHGIGYVVFMPLRAAVHVVFGHH